MTGSRENPTNSSTATGSATISYDDVSLILSVFVQFNGLTGGNASAAHIHCCNNGPGTNAGVAVDFGSTFPAATSGTYSNTFNLGLDASFNTTFRNNNGGTAATARSALLTGLAAGRAYVNIHNATFPGGEIRGDVLTPEPASFVLMGAGLLAIGILRRR